MTTANCGWLTVKEAAERAKVSPWTIYRACELKELRHVRLGGRRAIRLTREALDEWMLQHERAPVGEVLGAGPPLGHANGPRTFPDATSPASVRSSAGEEGAHHA